LAVSLEPIWGYQPHFRIGVSSRAKDLFEALGPSFEAEVFLVALGHASPNAPEVILEADIPEAIAPGLEGLPVTLARVTETQREENRNVFIAGPDGVAERYEKRIPLGVARRAVLEHLAQSPLAHERRFWAGSAHEIEGFRVVPVLSLSSIAVAAYPSLSKETVRGPRATRSLIEAVADEFLAACGRALRLPNAGERLVDDLDLGNTEDLLRRAAANLMYIPVFAGGDLRGLGGLFSACESLSLAPYERSETYATLLVCRQDHPSIEPVLALAEPVALRSARAARKLLQMSGEGISILCDGTSIWGMGRPSTKTPYDSSLEDIFEVRFTGRTRWEFRHAGAVLFQVQDRRVAFPPRAPIEEKEFRTFLIRMVPGIVARGVDELWKYVQAVLSAGHGAILVISPVAAQESLRLKSQGTVVEPNLLEPSAIVAATRIDGAVLLDPEGVCHAVGVILDGLVTPDGRSSRGSRFNSAVQYVSYRRGTVAVVVSDDGTVDLLPSLRPQISRGEVEAALAELRAIRAGKIPFGRLGEVMEALYALEFYLSAEQCAEANRLRSEIEAAHPPEAFELRLVHRDLAPNPKMDDSFFAENAE